MNELPEHLRLLDQRIDPLLRVALGHLDGRLHRHHRAWRLVDHVPDPVVAALRPADLRAFHEDRALDQRHGREAVHDLAQVRRPIRAPLAGFGRRALRERPVLVGPLRDREQTGPDARPPPPPRAGSLQLARESA